VVTVQKLADGTTQTVTTKANGTKVLVHTGTDGVTTETLLDVNVPEDEALAALNVSGDPLATTAYLVTSDPLLTAAAIMAFQEKEAAMAPKLKAKALSVMSAAQALAYSFPRIHLSGLPNLAM
jgi:hypothetical protein